jgi:hypothetical protein
MHPCSAAFCIVTHCSWRHLSLPRVFVRRRRWRRLLLLQPARPRALSELTGRTAFWAGGDGRRRRRRTDPRTRGRPSREPAGLGHFLGRLLASSNCVCSRVRTTGARSYGCAVAQDSFGVRTCRCSGSLSTKEVPMNCGMDKRRESPLHGGT